jgi:hypothetical protein
MPWPYTRSTAAINEETRMAYPQAVGLANQAEKHARAARGYAGGDQGAKELAQAIEYLAQAVAAIAAKQSNP